MLQRQRQSVASKLFQELTQSLQAAGGGFSKHLPVKGTLLQPTIRQVFAAVQGNGFAPALAVQLPTHGLQGLDLRLQT